MSLYFFHLRNGADTILDPEGSETATDAVAGKALWQARDCMAGDVKSGSIDLGYRIDVHDEAGEKVHSIAFVDALEIIPANRNAS